MVQTYIVRYCCILWFSVLQASAVKLVADKVSPADKIQLVTLLKGTFQYLVTATPLTSTTVVYDDPLITIRNLISSIEGTNYSLQDKSIDEPSSSR